MIRPGPWRTTSTTTSFGGGLILTLDLKQAYDRLPREHLPKGLDLCGCPPELSTVLLSWLHQAQYHVRHRGLEGSLTPERGVRQGCKASPLEWTAFLIYVCQRIGDNITNGTRSEAFTWICEHLITYADDLLFKWRLLSKQQFTDALQHMGCILDCLEGFGLQVSFDKTAILAKIEGTGAKTIMKRHTVVQDGKRWLRIPRHHGHSLIQLTSSHTYLGAKLSFLNFEQLTLKHRLQLGKVTYTRVRKWFTGRHALTSHDRSNLWSACILSSYAHGLGSSGLRQEGMQLLCNKIHANIRSLARSPSHITHETNEHIRQRLHLPEPKQYFQGRWTSAFDKFERNCHSLDPNDFMHRIPIHRIRARILKVFQADDPRCPVDEPTTKDEVIHSCAYCSYTAETAELLKRHLSKKHKAHPLYSRLNHCVTQRMENHNALTVKLS